MSLLAARATRNRSEGEFQRHDPRPNGVAGLEAASTAAPARVIRPRYTPRHGSPTRTPQHLTGRPRAGRDGEAHAQDGTAAGPPASAPSRHWGLRHPPRRVPRSWQSGPARGGRLAARRKSDGTLITAVVVVAAFTALGAADAEAQFGVRSRQRHRRGQRQRRRRRRRELPADRQLPGAGAAAAGAGDPERARRLDGPGLDMGQRVPGQRCGMALVGQVLGIVAVGQAAAGSDGNGAMALPNEQSARWMGPPLKRNARNCANEVRHGTELRKTSPRPGGSTTGTTDGGQKADASPRQRGYKTSMRHLLYRRTLAWSPPLRNLQGALAGRSGLAIRGARGTPGPTEERALGTTAKPTSVPLCALCASVTPTRYSCFIMNTWVRHRRMAN